MRLTVSETLLVHFELCSASGSNLRQGMQLLARKTENRNTENNLMRSV